MARFVTSVEAALGREVDSVESQVVLVGDNFDGFSGCNCVRCVCDRAAELAGMRVLWVDVDDGVACFDDEYGALVIDVHGLTTCELLFVLLCP